MKFIHEAEDFVVFFQKIYKTINEEFKHLPPPSDDETEDAFKELGATEILYKAVVQDQPEIAKLAIERGANVNFQNRWDDSLLHIATEHNNLEMVKILVEAGANIEIKNRSGITPLIVANYNDYMNIVKYLVDAGDDINTKAETNELYKIAKFKLERYLEKNF